MLTKTSRFMLILLVIMITSIYLPHYYWMSFSERIRPSYVQFSPILEDFVIIDYLQEKFFDSKGNEYTREKTDELLPLAHYRLLATKGLLPDTIQGKKIEIDEIRLNSINFRVRPIAINTPQIPLYPLFESKPERLKLEMPEEFFRITESMEFINCETNEIDQELSNSFTKVLISNDFEFPSKFCYGNPTTRKPFDEGYFVFDNNNELYHIKKIKGKPFCNKINVPEEIHIKKIFLREYSLKEFYAFILTNENDLYILLFDNYKFQKLPVKNYNSDEDVFRFQGDLFYRTMTLYKENKLMVFVANRNYELIDYYEEKWLSNKERSAGIISNYIFPFELEVNSGDSSYVDFYFSDYHFLAIYFNLILVLLTMFLMYRKNITLTKGIIDYLIVLSTGIFGFIAVNIFRYED